MLPTVKLFHSQSSLFLAGKSHNNSAPNEPVHSSFQFAYIPLDFDFKNSKILRKHTNYFQNKHIFVKCSSSHTSQYKNDIITPKINV